MIRLTPAIRISIGLVFITLSVLLFGSFIGLLPDQSIVDLKVRKSMAESVAAQCTLAARDNNVDAIQKTMDAIVKLQPDILSLGMRNTTGGYRTQTQDHTLHWVAPSGGDSTSTHWQVPIYQGNTFWATLEISFTPQGSFVVLGYRISSFNLLLLFFALISFMGFSIFMRKTLQHLDPTKVMPKRVKYAFNTLTEGIILLDKEERIILANTAFADNLGCTDKNLMGLKVSSLDWIDPETNRPFQELPWDKVISCGKAQYGFLLNLNTKDKGVRKLSANIAPIIDDKGKSRGGLITLDDVTELEMKNIQLMDTIEKLQQSRYKVDLQNQELEILAAYDSLTGCLNRRSFFEKAEQCLATAARTDNNISCIMIDLDLFKNINDTYGHIIGDKVLNYAAGSLKSVLRGDDVLGRYGGEEFCIMLPNCNVDNAFDIAERMRKKITAQVHQAIPEAPGICLSASFGISDSKSGARSIEELIKHADDALYKAKDKGRNCIVCWKSEKELISNKPEEEI